MSPQTPRYNQITQSIGQLIKRRLQQKHLRLSFKMIHLINLTRTEEALINSYRNLDKDVFLKYNQER